MKLIANSNGSLKFDYIHSEENETKQYFTDRNPRILKFPLDQATKVKLVSNLNKKNLFLIESDVKKQMCIITFNFYDLIKDPDLVDKALESALKLGYDPSRILFSFPEGKYDKEILNSLINKHNMLAEKGIASCFENWTMEEAIKFNTESRKLVNNINSLEINGKKLSNLEKFMVLYRFVADRYFTENEKDPMRSRNYISTFSGEYAVCVGFSELLTTLCDECGIICTDQYLFVGEKNDFVHTKLHNHKNNLVYIDDPKYNVKGIYIADATIDAKSPDHGILMEYFLLPPSDLKNSDEEFVFHLTEYEDYKDSPLKLPQYDNFFSGKNTSFQFFSNIETIILKRLKEKDEIKKLYLPSSTLSEAERYKTIETLFLKERENFDNLFVNQSIIDYKTIKKVSSIVEKAEEKLFGRKNDVLKATQDYLLEFDNEGNLDACYCVFNPNKSKSWVADMIQEYNKPQEKEESLSL